MNARVWGLIGLALVWSLSLNAQEPLPERTIASEKTTAYVKSDGLIELNLEGVSTLEQETQARAQLTKELTEQTAQKYIINLIGAKKAAQFKSQVQNLVRQSNKYIPYAKAGEMTHGPDGYKMSLNLKLSLTDLKELLSQEGLFYESESGAVALPLIVFRDADTKQSWWSHNPGSASLNALEKKFEDALRTEFLKSGFFVLKPVAMNLAEMVPSLFRIETLKSEDRANLADIFKAQMILVGEVVSENQHLVMKVAVHMASTNRFLAEVARSADLEAGALTSRGSTPHPFEELARDLSGQVTEAWKRGSFESEPLKLSINGPMSFQQMESLKSSLLRVGQVRRVRERLFAPERTVLEVDVSGSVPELAKQLGATKLEGASMQVGDVATDHIDVQLKTR